MPSLAIALRDEIRRLARKEIKAQTGRLSRAVVQYRHEIARLKRQLRELQKTLLRLESHAHAERQPDPSVDKLNGSTRFSARSVKAQRQRAGLSAADYARLVGVSPLTIYNWEHGKSRPRKEQFHSLVGLRGLGKREAQAKLKLLAARSPTPGSRRPRRKK
jgi:DNA-binding transcriptional regulator YiaG